MIRRPVHVTDDPRLLRTTTPSAFGFSLKQITAACLFSGLIAGAFSALTSESAADTGPAPAFSVNRVNKTDRLPSAPTAQLTRHKSSSATELRASGPIPAGCERAFSPIVHPARADILRHCLT